MQLETNKDLRQQSAKASFDHIYDCPDPQPYFQILQPLDYRSPQAALPIFHALVQALQQKHQREQLTILDLCCGYGVNAALVNHELTLDDLYGYYTDDKRAALPLVQRLSADKEYFARTRVDIPQQVIGIDVARNALAYARLTGLMERSYALDLEQKPLPNHIGEDIAEADLIIVTGGLSYVGNKTFRHLLEWFPAQRRPWIACFPLRISDFQNLTDEFSRFSLRSERLADPTFRQRRFLDEGEEERVRHRLHELKLDPTAKEADGYLHACCYLSRPAEDVIRTPLKRLLGNVV